MCCSVPSSSFAGGLLATRYGGGARTAGGLALVLGALTAGHLALIAAGGSVLALGAVLFLAGATIAPTEGTLYAMVDNAAPAGTITEAFAWLATATAVGNAIGAASAGALVDRVGPTAAFALAGGAGTFAVITTTLRRRSLAPGHAPVITDTDKQHPGQSTRRPAPGQRPARSHPASRRADGARAGRGGRTAAHRAPRSRRSRRAR